MQAIAPTDERPQLPNYRGGCIANVVPALLEHRSVGEGWVPDRILDADQVVLLVIDGLGWNQLAARTAVAPTMAAAAGVPITSVAPTTTAAGLTSIATGVPPGEHGIVGYKIREAGETLNVLRWGTENGDARQRIFPAEMQPVASFGGRAPVVITKAEFAQSGFTDAHLAGTQFRGYGALSTMVYEIVRAVADGERFVYAYYDGLDRVGHERGHGAEFDAEYEFVDALVCAVRDRLPPEVALAVTADHGQVDCRDATVPVHPAVMSHTHAISGEARFLWLHARPGSAALLLERALEHHQSDAWVVPVEQVIDEGWFGPRLTPDAQGRLGDVAMVAHTNAAFVPPDAKPSILIGRHGSMTADELWVPLLSIECANG